MIKFKHNKKHYCFTGREMQEYAQKRLDAMNEAMKKQIPKKPIDLHHCPTCENPVNLELDVLNTEYFAEDIKFDFCPYCGQAIDWSDE